VQLEVPRAFYRALRPLVAAARRGPAILDLGCGSGLLTERLARAGARAIGIDASRPMLRLARERCARWPGRVRLLERRLESLALPPRAWLALACGDVVNHLSSARVVERVFRSVRSALAPGGAFAFEAHTPYAYATFWSDNTHLLEGPQGDLLLDCDYDPRRRRAVARMIAYARERDGRHARAETTLYEYAHTDAEIRRAFLRAGFGEVWRRPWSPWPDADEPRLERNLWCGLDPGAGDFAPARALRALRFRRVARRAAA